MKRLSIFLFSLLLYVAVGAQTYQWYSDYVAVFAPTAVAQMEQYGVPASITLAQGLLESGAGRSDLTLRSNNHFGIKCTSDWTGKTTAHDDDKPKDCFRVYDDPADSYRDHSLFLKRSRYASLFELQITDYKGWAHGLRRCGYATDPNYPAKLIKLIEDYDLARYDRMTLADVEEASKEVRERYADYSKKKTKLALPSSKSSLLIAQAGGKQQSTTKRTFSDGTSKSMGSVSATGERKIKSVNNCKYITARRNDTYASIAEEYKIAEKRLRDFNEAGRLSQPQEGEPIFLQSKKNKSKQTSHKVREGETMRSVSQAEGIKLKKLYDYNTIPFGEQPAAGQVLRLRK